jgi:hypothetical protein
MIDNSIFNKRLDILAMSAFAKLFTGNFGSKTNPLGTRHIMFSIVDHFEPYHGDATDIEAIERVESWQTNYPLMANKHTDADGCHPRHTWFYPPHCNLKHLVALVNLSHKGYGEVEMHLHHNHMPPFPDTSETLKNKILKCVEDYSKHGIFCLPDGTKTFAFVHGDWSLDNACGDEICGVNDEISILRECGCYADFTFPSLGIAQPGIINKMYYVKDDPHKPKSYNKGKEVISGGKSWGDLLMVTGIFGARLVRLFPFPKVSIECSGLDGIIPPSSERIDYWIDNAVSVKGRPDWLFIKLHVHGAVESAWSGQLFQGAHDMYGYLESQYNDGNKYRLHYVSAREMFNIVKAAESEKYGDPNDYRNFVIPRYTYLS